MCLLIIFSFTATYGARVSARLSVLFDVGGVIGGILAGYLSDLSGMNASICSVMLALATPMVIEISCERKVFSL